MNSIGLLKDGKLSMRKRVRSPSPRWKRVNKPRLCHIIFDSRALLGVVASFVPCELYRNCLLNRKWTTVFRPYINKVKEQLYWRISIEYCSLDTGLDIHAVWVKVGYFANACAEVSDKQSKDKKAIVYQGRGQGFLAKMIKEHPTCQVAIDTRFALPRPLDILPYEGKNNAMFIHYHTVDIEKGQFSSRAPDIYNEIDGWRSCPQQIGEAILYRKIANPDL